MVVRSLQNLNRFLPQRLQSALRRRLALSCPVCECAAPVLFDGTRDQKVYICPDCRHLFWDSVPSNEDLTRFYQDEYCETHHQVQTQETHRAYYRSHVDELVNLIGKPKEEVCLVDYGSSIPVLVREAQGAGVAKAVAVDLDQMSWDYAQQHGLMIMTPDQYAKLPTGSVDIIRFSHVLEHLIDPVAAVAIAVDKLKPGGLLYITQPGFPVFQARRTDYQLKDSAYPKHLHFFSPISLVKLVSRFPLRITKLFSVTRHAEVFAELAPLIDLEYAAKKLVEQKDTGEACRGLEANYPYYTGENSALYARRLAV